MKTNFVHAGPGLSSPSGRALFTAAALGMAVLCPVRLTAQTGVEGSRGAVGIGTCGPYSNLWWEERQRF